MAQKLCRLHAGPISMTWSYETASTGCYALLDCHLIMRGTRAVMACTYRPGGQQQQQHARHNAGQGDEHGGCRRRCTLPLTQRPTPCEIRLHEQ